MSLVVDHTKPGNWSLLEKAAGHIQSAVACIRIIRRRVQRNIRQTPKQTPDVKHGPSLALNRLVDAKCYRVVVPTGSIEGCYDL